ncbi:hypothetical protein F511_25321 [Dorcoceras hygrometricum]|uniref:Uncharacterized protein n=1 Tax=Dorcoceras hygrometricum TaxID=472368 RepID=A0A2Z7BRF8_9LAMI|nr:hypothetical protein F511_25321 [Dorcoceras hygrometricum]
MHVCCMLHESPYVHGGPPATRLARDGRRVRTNPRLVPTSSTRELALQRLNSYGLLIRSTIGISIPSLACTRNSTKASQTESPHRDGWNNFRLLWRATAAAAGDDYGGAMATRGMEEEEEKLGRAQAQDTTSRGLTKFVTLKTHFWTYPSDHGKRLATLPHDPLGITDSACKNQSVMVSDLCCSGLRCCNYSSEELRYGCELVLHLWIEHG